MMKKKLSKRSKIELARNMRKYRKTKSKRALGFINDRSWVAIRLAEYLFVRGYI